MTREEAIEQTKTEITEILNGLADELLKMKRFEQGALALSAAGMRVQSALLGFIENIHTVAMQNAE